MNNESQVRQSYSGLSTEDLLNVFFEEGDMTTTAYEVWVEILLSRGVSSESLRKITSSRDSAKEISRLNELFNKLANIIDKTGYEIISNKLRKKKGPGNTGWKRVRVAWLFICLIIGVVATLSASLGTRNISEERILAIWVLAVGLYFLPIVIVKVIQWIRAGFLESGRQ